MLVKHGLVVINQINMAGANCYKQSFTEVWCLQALPHLCCIFLMLPVCESQWFPMSSRLGNPYCCGRMGPLWGETKALRPMLWPLVALGGNHADEKKRERSTWRWMMAPRKRVELYGRHQEQIQILLACWLVDFQIFYTFWLPGNSSKSTRAKAHSHISGWT